jgi:Cobalamin-independent synthase, Catalytic domain
VTHPWPAGSVTAIGSMPGTDPVDAAALVFGELPDLPYLPELPDRGPGADLIGRGASLLLDLPVELVPSGWRLTAHRGLDLRRARDLLAWDLDALESAAQGYDGALKLQVAGPWTLAASVELPSGHKVISDAGAVRDLVSSLAEGLAAHLAAVRAQVPGAAPVLQLDEPSLPAVLAGRIPTPYWVAPRQERGSCTVVPPTSRFRCSKRPARAQYPWTPHWSPPPSTTRSARPSTPA